MAQTKQVPKISLLKNAGQARPSWRGGPPEPERHLLDHQVTLRDAARPRTPRSPGGRAAPHPSPPSSSPRVLVCTLTAFYLRANGACQGGGGGRCHGDGGAAVPGAERAVVQRSQLSEQSGELSDGPTHLLTLLSAGTRAAVTMATHNHRHGGGASSPGDLLVEVSQLFVGHRHGAARRLFG